MKKKRIVPLLLSTAMLVSLLPSCSQPEDTPSPTPTGEAAVEDGYIPAKQASEAIPPTPASRPPNMWLLCSTTTRTASPSASPTTA